jgi:hypothetical protein
VGTTQERANIVDIATAGLEGAPRRQGAGHSGSGGTAADAMRRRARRRCRHRLELVSFAIWAFETPLPTPRLQTYVLKFGSSSLLAEIIWWIQTWCKVTRHFPPESSIVPTGHSTDKGGTTTRSRKEDVENDASVSFKLGFVGSILRSEEILAQDIESSRSFIDAMCHVKTIREVRSDPAPKI